MREQLTSLRALVVPIDNLDMPMSDQTRRVARLFDQLGYSAVLDLGYGMGEAVAVAADVAPSRIGQLIAATDCFDDDEILGRVDTERVLHAVACRNELLDAVRDVLRDRPKAV